MTGGFIVAVADETAPRRRVVLRAALAGGVALLSVGTGCDDTRTPENDTPMTDSIPTAEEVQEGARYLTGSNSSDPSATYTVLVSPEGTDVVIAAARTSR